MSRDITESQRFCTQPNLTSGRARLEKLFGGEKWPREGPKGQT